MLMTEKKKDTELIIQIVIIAVLSLLLVYNIGKVSSGKDLEIIKAVSASDVIPAGTPKIYGEELGVNYDDISPNNPQKEDATIRVLGNLDNTITLAGEDLQRYVKIASQISCEYCCGAESIIFTKDVSQYKAGDAACG